MKTKINYCEGSKTIRTNSNCCVAYMHNNRWVLDIDPAVPLEIASKLFRRWHQLHTWAKPELLAKALDDALNTELYIVVNISSVRLYKETGELNETGIEYLLRREGVIARQGDYFSCRHDIPSNQLHYWEFKTANRQEIDIVDEKLAHFPTVSTV